MPDKILIFLKKYKLIVRVFYLLLVILSLYSLRYLKADNSLETWFPVNSREIREYYDFINSYGSDETFLIVFKGVNNQLIEELGNREFVSGIKSQVINNHTSIIIMLDKRFADSSGREAYIGEIKRIVEKSGEDEVYYAGMGLLFYTLNLISQSNGLYLGGLGFLLALAALIFFISNRKKVIISLIIISVNFIINLGLFSRFSAGINMVNMIIPALIIIYSVSDIIHIFNIQDLKKVFIPCLLTTLTTAAGFFALSFTKLPILRELGLFTSISILITFINTFILIGTIKSLERDPKKHNLKNRFIEKLINRMSNLVENHSYKVVTLFIVITLLTSLGIFKLNSDTFSLGFLRDGNRVVMDSKYIESNIGFYTPLEFRVEARDLKKINAFISKTIEHRDIDGFFTMFSFKSSGYFPESPDTFKKLTRLLPKEVVNNWYRKDKNEVRISFKSRMLSANSYRKLIKEIKDSSELKVEASGYIPLYVGMMNYITETQIKSFLTAFIIIFFIISLISGSLKTGLITIPVNIFPIVIVLGIMGWFGISIDIATATIAAVGLGIIVDDSIHYLHIYRVEGDYKRALKVSGRAIISTSILIFLAFILLLFAQVKSIQYFGFLISILVIFALFADLLLLPSIIKITEKKGKK